MIFDKKDVNLSKIIFDLFCLKGKSTPIKLSLSTPIKNLRKVYILEVYFTLIRLNFLIVS